MSQFQALGPNVEVCGAAVMSVVEGLGAFRPTGLKILRKQGIDNPQAEKWYLQQAWLNAFQEIARDVGDPVLRNIGSMIPETAVWPPDVKSIAQALASIDAAYYLNHRNGPIGHYRFEQTAENAGRFVCDNPYPCAFDLGIIEGTSRKFAPADAYPLVEHDATQPCRKNGGGACTYNIMW